MMYNLGRFDRQRRAIKHEKPAQSLKAKRCSCGKEHHVASSQQGFAGFVLGLTMPPGLSRPKTGAAIQRLPLDKKFVSDMHDFFGSHLCFKHPIGADCFHIVLLSHSSERIDNFALNNNYFYINSRWNIFCRKDAQSMQYLLKPFGSDGWTPLGFDQLELGNNAMEASRRIICQNMSNVSERRAGCGSIRCILALRTLRLPTSYCKCTEDRCNRADCLNPVSPFRFVESHVETRNNKCTASGKNSQRVSYDARLQMVDIDCHREILS